jgi:microcystin degradation protein MlrC
LATSTALRRVAIASYQQESNSLSPLPALRQSFEDGGLGASAEALDRVCDSGEWAGALAALHAAGRAEAVPVWAAHAVSGGPLPAALHREIRDSLLEGLEAAHRAAPLDGVLLILHGATLAHGCDDVAGDTLHAVRRRFGPGVPLVATLDMHANVTPAMVEAADVLVAYHTYPHVDLEDTGERGMRALLRIVEGAPRPRAALRRLPLIVPPENGGTGRDDALYPGEPRPAPLADLMPRVHAWERTPGQEAAVFLVQPWLDVPDLGSSVLVYGDDLRAAAQMADDVAGAIWDRRRRFFEFPMLDPAEAVAAAFAAPAGPMVLSDPADSTGSGATADGTAILAALLAAADRRPSYVSLVDPHAVEVCHRAGAGREVETPAGARLDGVRHVPVLLRGEVTWTGEGAFRCEGPQWHGKLFRAGRAACVRTGAHRSVHVVLTERPCFVWDPGYYRMARLDVREAHIAVVKSAGAYRAAFKGIASRSISVDGPGASPSNLLRIESEMTRVRRPLYPWDAGCVYSTGSPATSASPAAVAIA